MVLIIKSEQVFRWEFRVHRDDSEGPRVGEGRQSEQTTKAEGGVYGWLTEKPRGWTARSSGRVTSADGLLSFCCIMPPSPLKTILRLCF